MLYLKDRDAESERWMRDDMKWLTFIRGDEYSIPAARNTFCMALVFLNV
jgi:hypothetical protein